VTTTVATTDAAVASRAPVAAPRLRTSTLSAFGALLLRDLTVLRKNLKEFIPRTILQPLLLVFVFTYVFPKIGQGIGGRGAGASVFSSVLVAGVVATAILFQGIQAVALPLVQEFGYTREIEDRVLAPLSVSLVAFEKIVSGGLQCLFAGLIVFPIATIVPATPVPMLFGVILIPITFLGCTYYSWLALEPVKWLQVGVLVNPLVYLSEGFRSGLTPVPHMSLLAVYPVLTGFVALFTYLGIRGFTRRVIA
jgi:ABC-2 type transport system permease protein